MLRAQRPSASLSQALGMGRRYLMNLARHGLSAPVPAERIWVDPMIVSDVLPHGVISRAKTGVIRSGDWDLKSEDLLSQPKVMVCIKHWVEGLSWDEAGGFRLDGARRDASELALRYSELDRMFARMQEEKRILSTTELGNRSWLSRDEIYVHIGRGPRLIFGGKGFHRMSAARALGIRCVPAVLGAVHEEAVEEWTSVVQARSWSRPTCC